MIEGGGGAKKGGKDQDGKPEDKGHQVEVAQAGKWRHVQVVQQIGKACYVIVGKFRCMHCVRVRVYAYVHMCTCICV